MFKNMKSTIMLGWVLSGLFLVFPVNGWAGDDEQDQPRLTVSAEGKINVPPDKAVLSFAVETVGKKLAKVQQENQERMARVLKECQKLKIPPKFIQTTSLNVIPEYPPPPAAAVRRVVGADHPPYYWVSSCTSAQCGGSEPRYRWERGG
jgi:uncharacterized protein YggE